MSTARTWTLRLAALAIAAAAGSAIFVYAASEAALNRTFAVSALAPAVATSPAGKARGRHLVEAVGTCAECHGLDLGGKTVAEGSVGRIVAPNLTAGRGGLPADWAASDWARALRHGVARDGRGLWMMPVRRYAALTDDDLGAIIAFLADLPAVDRESPRSTLSLFGRTVLALGRLPLIGAAEADHAAPAAAVTEGVTPAYGSYLAGLAGCAECHGPTLRGGPAAAPGAPPAPDITGAALADWAIDDFRRVFRDGVGRGGDAIDGMPWRTYGRMTDDELAAIFAWLRTR
jgi:mono/diheme cytochrome c family protein